MCWNSQVSLNTFLFGLFGIILGWLNGYPIVLLIFLFVLILMQFVEYILWKSINKKNKSLNKLFSFLGFCAVLIQPIASILLLYPTNKQLMYLFLGIYIIGLGSIIAFSPNKSKKDYFISYVGKNGHLVWNWGTKQNVNWIFVLLHVVCLLIPLLLTKHYAIFFVVFITLLLSLFFYYNYDTWGTMWCWTANIIIAGFIAKILFFDVICK